MKKWFYYKAVILSILAASFLTGCLKDTCKSTYTIYQPIYKTLTQVRSEMKSSQPVALEQTGKLYLYGNYIFLNEVNKGIHIIDNSNPKAPKNISFINIPGNVDLAVKGSYLYADSYADMIVFNISNPNDVKAGKIIEKVFPDRSHYYLNNSNNPDSIQVIVGYNTRDTTVDCETYRVWANCPTCVFTSSDGGQFYAAPTTGIGGSMARFTIVNDFLYTVTNHELFSFDVSNEANPLQTHKAALGNWGIETIYPFKNNLFIGSNNGMYIYSLSNPSAPSYVSQFSHVRSCDPVIADDYHAYVTLRSGTQCQGFINQMEVLNITQLSQPKLVKTYQMTNPHGLSKDDDLLFVCDGKDGLKIYNAADASNIKLIKTITGIETFDVILNNKVAIVVAKDGLHQYDYSNINNIKHLSKLSIRK